MATKIFTMPSQADLQHQAEVNARKEKQRAQQLKAEQQRVLALQRLEERLAAERILGMAQQARGNESAAEYVQPKPRCVSSPPPADELHCLVSVQRRVLDVIPAFATEMEQRLRERVPQPVKIFVSDAAIIEATIDGRRLTVDEGIRNIVKLGKAHLTLQTGAALHICRQKIALHTKGGGAFGGLVDVRVTIFTNRGGFLHFVWETARMNLAPVCQMIASSAFRSRVRKSAQVDELVKLDDAVNRSYLETCALAAPALQDTTSG